MSERKSKIPNPPAPASVPGNLLSSVAPPSQLPNFVTAVVPPAPAPQPEVAQPAPPQVVQPVPVQPVIVQHKTDQRVQAPETFSPAIPLSKGEPMQSIRSPEDSQTTQSPESLPESSPEVEKIGDIMPGSGLLTWMKGAVSSGGILQRVAEKAKNSVDSMITTLDPQMKEYLKSGGDLYVVVASDKDVKISPIREAFQTVFGKATVVGYPAQSDVTAAQPVGYAAAYAAAKQRIAHIRSVRSELNNNIPVVAIENFLHEAIAERWYDVSLLVLSQPSLGIEVQAMSQGAPVAAAAVSAAEAATPDDYEHKQTGYSVTIGSIMADSLQVPHTQWQEASTGVSRREVLVLAARSLAGSYKRFQISANMNILIVVLALITVTSGSPVAKTWTLYELSEAIERNTSDAELKSHLVDALNTIMLAIFTGENQESVGALIRSPDGGTLWNQAELMKAIKDPKTKPAYRNFYRRAYHYLEMNKDQKSVEVNIPALAISTWTRSEIKEALGNRATHPDLIPYLRKAEAKFDKDTWKEKVTIVTPVGLVKSEETNILPKNGRFLFKGPNDSLISNLPFIDTSNKK